MRHFGCLPLLGISEIPSTNHNKTNAFTRGRRWGTELISFWVFRPVNILVKSVLIWRASHFHNREEQLWGKGENEPFLDTVFYKSVGKNMEPEHWECQLRLSSAPVMDCPRRLISRSLPPQWVTSTPLWAWCTCDSVLRFPHVFWQLLSLGRDALPSPAYAAQPSQGLGGSVTAPAALSFLSSHPCQSCSLFLFSPRDLGF